MRRVITGAAALALSGVLAAVVLAGTVNGTAKNDNLRGSAKADTINGKAGNDKLYGLAGNDKLIGGAGNDLLVGGPGADNLNCGAGADAAQADDSDTVSPSCEKVTGITPPDVSIADASVVEGNSGNATLAFQVSLSKASKQPASVSYSAANGSASAPDDYAAASGKLTFAPGEKSKSVNIAVVGEPMFESDETLTVTLSSPVNATIADGSATGTITNDDIKNGRYSGSTSQGRPLTFDVSPTITGLANLHTFVDMTCVEVPVVLRNSEVDFAGLTMPIAPDMSVNYTDSYSDAEGSASIAVAGKLSMPGNASGTIRIDVALNLSFGVVHCSTGTVNWTAAAP